MQDLLSTIGRALTRNIRNASPIPYTSRGGIGGGGVEGMSADAAYEAYGSVGTLFAIVSQISNAFASVPWHLYQRTSVRDKKRRKEIPNHPFLEVWDMPNPFYTGRLFRETVQQHLDLVGEGVIVLARAGSFIAEMWPVRPDRIHPVKHPEKFLTGYVYKNQGEEVPLKLEDVIHIKYPNPSDPYSGLSPVSSVINDIRAARFAAQWNENFFINGARPGGIIEVDYRMGDKEWRQFLSRWREQHQGVANAHRVAVLENAKWVDTNFSMTDMQFVELRNLPRELIREAFAFPKPMLGTVDDVNRANAQAGKEIMAENQTVPRLERWKDIINVFLLPQFAGGKALALDYENPVPASAEDEDRRLTTQTAAWRNLVLGGMDPKDASLICGLPDNNWVGIPAPLPPEAQPEKDEDTPIEPSNRRGKASMPVIDFWGGETTCDTSALTTADC